MKRPLLLLAFAFIIKSAFAQVIEKKVENFIQAHSIDSFLVYTYTSNGGGISFDSCNEEVPQYLLWQEKGDTYLKRFDYCSTYKTIPIASINPFSFYLANKLSIDKDTILAPEYIKVYRRVNGKKEVISTTITIDHSYFHEFLFSINGNTIRKIAKVFDLDYKSFDNGKKNIHYDRNQKTKLKLLIDLTNDLIYNLLGGKSRFETE